MKASGTKYNIFNADAAAASKLNFFASVSEKLLITSANGYIDHPGHIYKKNSLSLTNIDYKESSNHDLYSEFAQTNSNNELITYRPILNQAVYVNPIDENIVQFTFTDSSQWTDVGGTTSTNPQNHDILKFRTIRDVLLTNVNVNSISQEFTSQDIFQSKNN